MLSPGMAVLRVLRLASFLRLAFLCVVGGLFFALGAFSRPVHYSGMPYCRHVFYSLFMRLYNNIALLIHLPLFFFAKVGASMLLFFPLRQFRRLPVCSPVVLPFNLMSIVCMLTIVFDRFMCLSVLL